MSSSTPKANRDVLYFIYLFYLLILLHSPPPTVASTNGSTISTRSKRRETASHQHTPAKKTRSSTQAVAQSPEQDSVELPLQQLDCALDGNHNGYDGEVGASSSTRVARTKQNEILRFPEKYDTFRVRKRLTLGK